jgi:hypothetical protein
MGDVLHSQFQLGRGEATIDGRSSAEDEAFFRIMMPEGGRIGISILTEFVMMCDLGFFTLAGDRCPLMVPRKHPTLAC